MDTPRQTKELKYKVEVSFLGEEYEDRILTVEEKKVIKDGKGRIRKWQEGKFLRHDNHSTNFVDFVSELDDFFKWKCFEEDLDMFFITYNFNRQVNFDVIQKRIETHYVSILIHLFGKRNWHKYWKRHPIIFLFPERYPGTTDSYHYHGILMVHESVSELLCRPLYKYYLNCEFQKLSPCTNRQFHIMKISYDSQNVLNYMMKKHPYLSSSIRVAGYDMIILPKSRHELGM